MRKRFFILLAVVLFLFLFIGYKNMVEHTAVKDNAVKYINIPKEKYCINDNDCVKAECCHAKTCVNIDYKPDCDGITCTMVCEPDTLDCGQGICRCVDNKCRAVIKEIKPKNESGQLNKLANPASVYCVEQGYKIEIRENKFGQYGVCVFNSSRTNSNIIGKGNISSNNINITSECEEWAYYRGECSP